MFSHWMILSLCFAATALACSDSKHKSKEEKVSINDDELLDVDSALLKLYNDNQILFIGHADHSSTNPQKFVERLIRLVGNDENLTGIALERYHDNESAFQEVMDKGFETYYESKFDRVRENSLIPFDQQPVEVKNQLLSTFNTLCLSGEWSYTFQHFASNIRAATSYRAKPLKIFAIDGIHSQQLLDWPSLSPENNLRLAGNPECPGFKRTEFNSSSRRELATAQRFEDLYSALAPQQKLIVLYHVNHLVTDTTGCLADFEEGPKDFKVKRTDLNWAQIIREKFPEIEAKSKLVFFDSQYKNAQSKVDLSSNFDFVSRLLERSGNKDFFIGESTLARFSKPYLEYLNPKSHWSETKTQFHFRSELSMADQFAGIFHIEAAPDSFVSDHTFVDYYPGICKAITGNGFNPFQCKSFDCTTRLGNFEE